MNAPKVQADYDELKNIASLFACQGDGIKQLSNQAQRQCSLLASGGWIGKGAQSFYREMDDLVLPAVSRLANALQQASYTVQQIARTFDQAEREAGSLFTGADTSVGTAAPTATASGSPFDLGQELRRVAWDRSRDFFGVLSSTAFLLIDHSDVLSKATKLKVGAFASVMEGLLNIAYDVHSGKPLNDELVVPHMMNAAVQAIIGAKTGGVVPLVNAGVQLVGGLYADGAKMLGNLAMPFAPNAAPDLMHSAGELSRSLKSVDLNTATFNVLQTGYVSLKQHAEANSRGMSDLLGSFGGLFGDTGRQIGSAVGSVVGAVGGGLLGGLLGTFGGVATESVKFAVGAAETVYHAAGTSFNIVRVGVEALGHPDVQRAVSGSLTDIGRALGFAR
ncbi:MAG: WXG100 family type VII secretion target [Anaerolineae bacterium]|nr:WXG100 family type VII secretion target [Anaerolineae bacterium]